MNFKGDLLNQREKEKFSRDVLRHSYDLDLIGISFDAAVASGLDELEEFLSLNAPDVMAKRAAYFSVPGTVPLDYSEKFYLLSDGRVVLAGIRHLSGDAGRPFVHFVLPFTPLRKDLAVLRDFATTAFSKFSPKQFSFSQRPGDFSQASRCHVVGRIQEIRGRPAFDSIPGLSFRPFRFESDLEWYRSAYEEFHASLPHLKEWVPLTDEEELRRSEEDGLIFVVEIAGRLAGLIAAEKRGLLGASGAYMNELLLVPPFKGRGFAPAIQRKFIDEFLTDVELIWGTIDSRNLSSMRTALRVGRKVIRSEYFLTCDRDHA